MDVLKQPLIAILGLHLLLSGCGGKPSAPADSAPAPTTQTPAEPPATGPATPQAIQVCELLPLEDAQVVAGTALAPGTEGPAHSPSCTYTGPASGPLAQVEIYVGDGAKKFLDIDRELNHLFTPVPGIGDEAHEEENAIFFRKGATWVAVRLVRLNDPAENREPLKAAATKVVGRLG